MLHPTSSQRFYRMTLDISESLSGSRPVSNTRTSWLFQDRFRVILPNKDGTVDKEGILTVNIEETHWKSIR